MEADSRVTGDGMPPNTHPDGRLMTQEEIDAYWLAHIYRPNEPTSVVRSIVTGMVLGGVMSLSNLYVGLKTGWGLAVTVTAAVLAYGIFTLMRYALPFGPFKREFTAIENNLMASTSSAAGYFTGAGLTSAIPALYMSTGFQLGPWQLALWILAISFLGVLLAVPMRRQMIDIDRLPFPEGAAYAETIRSLHADRSSGGKKALALLFGAIAGAGMKFAGGVLGLVKPAMALKVPLVPDKLPFFAKWHDLNLGFQTDILMIGAGGIMGVRICVGLLIGAVVGFGVLATWLHTHGLAGAAPTFGTVRTWLVWPGVALIVVNGLLAFGLKWRTALAALSGLGRLARGTRTGGMAEVEVPTTWFVRGVLLCTALTVVLAKVFFDIPMWMGLLAVALSTLLAIVACRATGETSITPVGALGKITQVTFAAVAPGNIQTNLMTSSVTAGAAMHSADLLTDLSGGYRLGARPRTQFVSQFFGIIAGAVFCIPVYFLLATPERLGSKDFPAPGAKTWQAVAELLAGGVDSKVRGQTHAMATTVQVLPLKLVPVGTKAGDAVRVVSGGDAGSYTVMAVVDKAVVLDHKFEGKRLSADEIEVIGRGKAAMAGAGKDQGKFKELPALALDRIPDGTRAGDYLRYGGDHDLWWVVKGVVGRFAIVDRPIVDPRAGAQKLPEMFYIEVRKESLPPYALLATILAALLAVAMTLVEVYAPAQVRQWVPSTTGLGLGFVVAGADSISMFIGAVLAWGFKKIKPKLADEYTQTSAAGIMAGASLAGILIIVLTQVWKVLVVPE